MATTVIMTVLLKSKYVAAITSGANIKTQKGFVSPPVKYSSDCWLHLESKTCLAYSIRVRYFFGADASLEAWDQKRQRNSCCACIYSFRSWFRRYKGVWGTMRLEVWGSVYMIRSSRPLLRSYWILLESNYRLSSPSPYPVLRFFLERTTEQLAKFLDHTHVGFHYSFDVCILVSSNSFNRQDTRAGSFDRSFGATDPA